MADDTQLGAPSGTGDVISTDDLGLKKVQRVKVQYGVDGSATDASTTNPLPVDQTNTTVADGGALPAKGVQVGGTDGTVFQVLSTDNAGRLNANINGTVPVSAAALPLPAGASTAAKQPALGTAGTASADVVSVQGVASMTALKTDGSGVTQPVSDAGGSLTVDGTVSITANSAVNVAQMAGTTTDTNSGVKSAGTQRVVLATDQPQLTNALKVDGSAVTQPVSGTVTANLGTAAVTNAGTFAVQDSEKIADDAAFTVGTTKLLPTGYLADQTATDSVNEGDIGAARITLDRKQIVTVGPSADTEGWTPSMTISAASTNATSVKGSAGKVGFITASNVNAAVRYLKLYNKATAPTVGTDVPVLVLAIPGNTAGAGTNIPIPDAGITFSTGIAFALTTGVATSDTGAVAANELVVNLGTT